MYAWIHFHHKLWYQKGSRKVCINFFGGKFENGHNHVLSLKEFEESSFSDEYNETFSLSNTETFLKFQINISKNVS